MPGRTPSYGMARKDLGIGQGRSEVEAKRAGAREALKFLEAQFSEDIKRLNISYAPVASI